MASSTLLSYENLTYEVKAAGGTYLQLVDNVTVQVRAGEVLAIMGPSGAGKTTLLELMSFRKQAKAGASIQLNGQPINAAIMDRMSAFMESEDVLLGVLTVRESIMYTLRLHDPLMSRKEVTERVERVISALGLKSCADNRIGFSFSRGISTGQKRRAVAACAMVTYPRILFLDEITSGLDSTSAEQVLAAVKSLAQEEGIIVIASIHQPSMSALSYFSNLLMLSGGKTCYAGSVDELGPFLERWGHPVPRYSTPPEYAMCFLNDDFEVNNLGLGPEEMRQYYLSTLNREKSTTTLPSSNPEQQASLALEKVSSRSFLRTTLVLCERTFKNYCRNILAYGTRLVVYTVMGLIVGSIAFRLSMSDKDIIRRAAFYFVTVAFLSFSAAAGIPAFLEERAVFYREKRNGLYTTLPFAVSNSLVNIPFLFTCSFLYTVVCYWMVGLQSNAPAFFSFLCYLFLGVLVAEAQMAAIAALLPILMAVYAIAALLNSLWMVLSGFLNPPSSLPRFWYYTFSQVNFMKYTYELLASSDLKGLTFFCEKSGDRCNCNYPLYNPVDCTISGQQVLDNLDIRHISYGKWVGILLGILIFYRGLIYIFLSIRSR